MKNLIRKSGEMVFFRFLCISLFLVWGLQVNAQVKDEQPSKGAQTRYPLPSGKQDGNPKQKPVTGLHLPAGNTSYVVDYDPLSGLYRVQKKVGVTEVGMPRYMDMAEYQKFEKAQASTNYFKDKVLDRDSTQDVERSIFKRFLNPTIDIEGFDKIFGSNKISIKPTGSAELRFGVNVSTQDNPSLEESLRTTTTFDFNEKIQMGVTGEIGTKLKVGINYNTEATFDFENKTKVGYTGDEDEIIQSIEAGNVSVPLNGTLITGGQNLFGVKTQLKFGRLKLTGVVSQQKSETQVVELKGGALQQEFSVTADNYDANRHFFLSHYFQEHFDEAMSKLPILNTGVNITKIEVWITNKNSSFEEARNILAIMDLGERKRVAGDFFATPGFVDFKAGAIFPDNSTNSLYDVISNTANIRDINNVTSALAPLQSYNFEIGQDFEKIQNARKLSSTEYKLNAQLGFISLNTALNADEILAVAFQFTYQGKTYQLGEFSNDNIAAPKTLILKMIKGTSPTPKLPMWDLMMKNIYATGAYQLQAENFVLNVMYRNDKTGKAINYIPEGQSEENGGINGKILLKVFDMDGLNQNGDPGADGVFDFLDNKTIIASNGRVIFPHIEPFGKTLAEKLNDPTLATKLAFYELYDSTQTVARQLAEKNKFYIAGRYESTSGSDIQLNASNVQPGSVTVTANGRKLDDSEYSVDYTLGRVTILNQALIESGTPIKVSLENNALFNIQTKTLIGMHADYEFSDNFLLGATLMHLQEKPLTNKVNIGSEPISNTIWGVDGRYRTETPWLTRMIAALPFLETKAPSEISVEGEFAQLIPGTASVIGEGGTAYIDDFEGTKILHDMKTPSAWVLASTPQGQNNLFPEANIPVSLANPEVVRVNGYNRAKLAWYTVSPDLLRDRTTKPAHITTDDQSNHLVREVYEQDIFPFKESVNGIPTTIQVLNLAFYPTEKGPYNFDLENSSFSQGLNNKGELIAPETRWGGVMRNITTNDFETNNIEFIEFWMMDPFVNDTDPTAGKGKNAYLYFNLGNVSEDILRDSRKSWENGLPRDAVVTNVDTTAWGRVSTQQFTVNAFDNNASSREFQDIGFDGLNDEDERSFSQGYLQKMAAVFGVTSQAYQKSVADPSTDDYHYYRGGDYDTQKTSILDRYKQFNGPEGNSPTSEQSPEYKSQATNLPDIEDINLDNTLSETESYFQYRVRITPEDLEVGKNFITDVREDTRERLNKETTSVKWYQFKIPIHEPDIKVGNIQDFKSIRFMRMFMRGFTDPTVLRFAKLDLVRGEWRKYQLDLTQASEGTQTDQSTDATFDISAVNIEENGNRLPINYVLPQGINRVTDPTNPQLRKLNEQSMVLKVKDLEDGDARAAFKTMDLDLRKYGRLKMEVHAEKYNTSTDLKDDDLRIFVRVGSDYKQNYYEYEIPLKVTPEGVYDNNSDADRAIVWPLANRFDFSLESFPTLKIKRDAEIYKGNLGVSLTTPYSQNIGDQRITVVGTPNLANVRTIMVGIRNPSRGQNTSPDDGSPHSAEVWINELRVSDFDAQSGWAANARMVTKMADFATISLSGNLMTPGFGSIEKKVSERNNDNIKQYDLSATFQLGKFFPAQNGVNIPVLVGYAESFKDPKYNPLDPDVELQKTLDDPDYPTEAKDKLLSLTRDYTRRKTFNITNAKIRTFRSVELEEKLKKAGTANNTHPLSISNFSASYNYSEQIHTDINTEDDRYVRRNGSLNYIWNNNPKPIEPFTKVKWLGSPWLRLVKDFNFYPLPSQLVFRTQIDRSYHEVQSRNVANPDMLIEPTYQKNFSWSREYGLRYNLTKALKIDFKANNEGLIDEPDGAINPNNLDYQAKRDSIWNNIKNFGRTTSYTHQINVTYNIPINKIPVLDWVSANARYTTNYNWKASAQSEEAVSIGNLASNYQTYQGNATLNFQSFYNKLSYLEKVNKRSMSKAKKDAKTKAVKWEDKDIKLRKKRNTSFEHDLKTTDIDVKVFDAKGALVDGKVKIIDKNKVQFLADTTLENVTVLITGNVSEKPDMGILFSDGILNLGMLLKNVSVSYSENNGSELPGYMPSTQYMGLGQFNNQWAPGWPFVLGWQDDNFAYTAAQNQWLSTDTLQTQPFVMTHQTNLNVRATLEPFPEFRIDVTANKTTSENDAQIFYPTNAEKYLYEVQSKLISGNYQITFGSIRTAFKRPDASTYRSEVFEQFRQYRQIIAWRLAGERTDASYDAYAPNIDSETQLARKDGYPNGYSPNSQDVLIPALIAAYSGSKPQTVGLDPFSQIPFPNWRLTYDGLTRIPFLARFFKKISLAHGYNSVFSVGSYRLDASEHDFYRGDDGYSYVRDILEGYFMPEKEVSNVTISEKFSPLISVDVNFDFGLTARFETRKSRNISLSLSNNQLIEMITDELIFGAGWRIEDLPINISVGGKSTGFKSDLNIRADFAIRDNMTIIHKLDQNADQITAGQKNTSIKLSADYNLSEKFNLRFYYDQTINAPRVSTSWRTSNTQVGFSLRFTII